MQEAQLRELAYQWMQMQSGILMTSDGTSYCSITQRPAPCGQEHAFTHAEDSMPGTESSLVSMHWHCSQAGD